MVEKHPMKILKCFSDSKNMFSNAPQNTSNKCVSEPHLHFVKKLVWKYISEIRK